MENATDLLNAQEGTFNSPKEMELSLKALLQLLTRKSSSGNIASYLIDRIEVDFSEKHKYESVWADFSRSTLVVCAPKKKSESSDSLQTRRQMYLVNFSVIIDELKTRALAQVYKTLTADGKKKLKNDYSKKKAQTRSKTKQTKRRK